MQNLNHIKCFQKTWNPVKCLKYTMETHKAECLQIIQNTWEFFEDHEILTKDLEFR